jgi:ribose transport system permease protein
MVKEGVNKMENLNSGQKLKNVSTIKTLIGRIFDNYLKETSAIFALVAIIIFFTIMRVNYFSPRNLLLILESSALVGVVAIGQFFVMLVGGIDLSIGSSIGLAGIISAYLMNKGLGTPVALLGGLAVGLLIGVFNGLIVTRLKIVDFITTLGSMFIAHGIILGMTRGYSIYEGMKPSFLAIGTVKFFGVSVVLIFFILVVIVSQIILSRTVFGRQLYATGGNKAAAKLMGVSVDRLKVIAYIISGLLGSCVGIFIVGRLQSGQPAAGDSFLFETILAVVLGGASLSGGEGTIIGTLIGAVFLSAVFNGLTTSGFPYYYQEIVKGILFLIAIAFSSVINMRRNKL